jgi:hypothetical protein
MQGKLQMEAYLLIIEEIRHLLINGPSKDPKMEFWNDGVMERATVK